MKTTSSSKTGKAHRIRVMSIFSLFLLLIVSNVVLILVTFTLYKNRDAPIALFCPETLPESYSVLEELSAEGNTNTPAITEEPSENASPWDYLYGGVWVEPDGDNLGNWRTSLEFFSDGTLIIGSEGATLEGSSQETGEFIVLDDVRLKVSFAGGLVTEIYGITLLEDGTIELSIDNSPNVEYLAKVQP
jgi:hypothetical protein